MTMMRNILIFLRHSILHKSVPSKGRYMYSGVKKSFTGRFLTKQGHRHTTFLKAGAHFHNGGWKTLGRAHDKSIAPHVS